MLGKLSSINWRVVQLLLVMLALLVYSGIELLQDKQHAGTASPKAATASNNHPWHPIMQVHVSIS
jgi:hypothetical protein